MDWRAFVRGFVLGNLSYLLGLPMAWGAMWLIDNHRLVGSVVLVLMAVALVGCLHTLYGRMERDLERLRLKREQERVT